MHNQGIKKWQNQIRKHPPFPPPLLQQALLALSYRDQKHQQKNKIEKVKDGTFALVNKVSLKASIRGFFFLKVPSDVRSPKKRRKKREEEKKNRK